ncbi:MAG: hypothetical protein Q9N34_06170 [Aquificota bacterium]|nr:hypothetical protein [Aquificota bacterium]
MGTKMKGETVEEIEGAGKFFRERATKVEVSNPENPLIPAGTGGDRSGTFNVSTVTAFVRRCWCEGGKSTETVRLFQVRER